MYEHTFPKKRFKHTLDFLNQHVSKSESILDLGIDNPLSELMKNEGFKVQNTSGVDLDLNTTEIEQSPATAITAFEIFEHLLSPFTVLNAIKANKLVASVPLKLWFAPAYRSKTDMRDRHYHEYPQFK